MSTRTASNGSRVRLLVEAGSTVAVLVASLVACDLGNGYQSYGGPPVGAAAVAGAWGSNCGATLELRVDGTGAVTNFPLLSDRTNLFSGAARWVIDLGEGWKSDVDPPMLEVIASNTLDNMNLASVAGKLGFAMELGDVDKDETWCIFKRLPKAAS